MENVDPVIVEVNRGIAFADVMIQPNVVNVDQKPFYNLQRHDNKKI